MYRLADNKLWQEAVRSVFADPNQRTAGYLKMAGYTFLANCLDQMPNGQKVLEVGHGAAAWLFKRYKDKHEMWGVDDTSKEIRSRPKPWTDCGQRAWAGSSAV